MNKPWSQAERNAEIIRLHAAGCWSYVRLAARYGIHPSSIREIVVSHHARTTGRVPW